MSPKLLKKIMKTADHLGYCGANPAAAALRRGQNGTIGILFTESLVYAIWDPAAHKLLEGIAQATEQAAIRLLLLPSPDDRVSALEAIRAAVVDGFLAYTLPTGDPLMQALLARRLPTVIIDEPRSEGEGFVGVDDESGAFALADHLLELGHRTFAVMTWPVKEDGFEGFAGIERQHHARYPVARNRMNGYASALEQRGMSWESVPVYEVPLNAAENGTRAARALFASSPDPRQFSR